MSDKVVVRWSRDIPSHPTIGRQVVKYINPQGIVGTVRVLAANEHGLQEITVVAMESTQWARLQALLDNSTGDSP